MYMHMYIHVHVHVTCRMCNVSSRTPQFTPQYMSMYNMYNMYMYM